MANDWGNYAITGTYAPGQLFKTITADEQNNQVIEFRDKKGQVILRKMPLGGATYANSLCTYYVYDDLGQLRLVIQPRGVELLAAANWSTAAMNNILNGFCFRYEYDARGRCVRKQLPDGGESWMVYDERDRLVMSQTAEMRAKKQWQYTQYDNLDRTIAAGLLTDQTSYNNLTYHLQQAYNSTVYPNLSNYTGVEEHIRNYYDNYTWRSAAGNPLSEDYNASYNNYLLPALATHMALCATIRAK